MKRIVGLLFGLLLMIGCGGNGGGGGAVGPGSAPFISNLSFYPSSATYMQGGGALDVTLYVNFHDPDADLKTVMITDSDGGQISGDISSWESVQGKTGGTLGVVVAADTSLHGTFTFQIWVVDSKGNSSNKLNGNFTVS